LEIRIPPCTQTGGGMEHICFLAFGKEWQTSGNLLIGLLQDGCLSQKILKHKLAPVAKIFGVLLIFADQGIIADEHFLAIDKS
jgi:hypothetical protein